MTLVAVAASGQGETGAEVTFIFESIKFDCCIGLSIIVDELQAAEMEGMVDQSAISATGLLIMAWAEPYADFNLTLALEGLVTLLASAGRRRTAATNVMVGFTVQVRFGASINTFEEQS